MQVRDPGHTVSRLGLDAAVDGEALYSALLARRPACAVVPASWY